MTPPPARKRGARIHNQTRESGASMETSSSNDSCVYEFTPNPPIPDGFTEVTCDQFFARLKADKRDIMPCHQSPNQSVWKDTQGRVFGVSMPGWKYPGRTEVYAISPNNS